MRLKNMQFGNLLIFTVDFDAPIFLNGTDARIPFSTYAGYDGTKQMPNTVNTPIGASYHCGDDTATSMATNTQDGPPSYLMVLPGTVQPQVTFLTLLQNKTLTNDTWLDNRISFGLIINSGQNHNYADLRDLIACQPTITFTISDENQVAFTETVTFTEFYQGTCDVMLLDAFLNNYNEYRTSLKNVQTKEDLQNIQFQSYALESSDIETDCINNVQSFIQYTDGIELLDNVKGCFRQPGDPAIATDPCCNQTAAIDQCCAFRDQVPFHYMKPSGFNGFRVEQCQHPDGITYILQNFAEAYQATQQAEITSNNGGGQDLWNKYSSFLQKCSSLIYNTQCKVDSDCKYSKKCDTRFSGNCAVNWGSQNDLLLQCYFDEMPADLRNEWSNLWGIPYFADQTEQIAAFWPVFQEKVLEHDCVGPQSQAFQVVDTWDQQTQQWVHKPGNQSGCLNVYSCNWNSWQNRDEASCTGTQVTQLQTDHLCGLFDGIQYQEFSNQPICRFSQAQTAEDCAARGGSWITASWMSGGGQDFCMDKNNSGSWQSCFAASNSSGLCDNIPNIVATLPPGQNWIQDPTCGSDLCYLDVADSQTCFNLGNQYRNDPTWGSFANNIWFNNGRCIRYADWNTPMNIAACNFFNFTIHYGKSYTLGRWYNPTECNKGVCSVSNLQMYPVTADECAARPLCSQPCARCQSMNRDMSGNEMSLCYDSSLTTQSDCQTQNGQWDFSNLICSFPAYTTYALCTAHTGKEFFNCSGLASTSSTCAALTGTAARILQCHWNDWADCRSAEECSGTGRCNDFDLSSWNGNSQSSGVCVQPWQYDQYGQRQWCQQQTTDGQSTGIMQTKLGCAKQNIVNATQCAALSSAGYTWIARATSQQSCLDHGSGCFMSQYDTYNYNKMSQSTCSECDGNFAPIYQYAFGETIASEILPLTWVQRQWAQVNQWKLTISWAKMNDAIQQAISSIVARQQLNAMSLKYNKLIPLMEIITCSCASDGSGVDCFNKVSAIVVDVECRKDPATINSCGALQWNDTTIFGNVSSSNVQVLRTMAGPFLLQFAQRAASTGRRLLASSTANIYAIVKNNQSVTVGQIIGDGVYFSNLTGSAKLCLTKSLMIDIVNSDFTVYDIVKSKDNQTLSAWLNETVEVNGLQLCINDVDESGIYFPIVRVTNPSLYSGPSDTVGSSALTWYEIVAIVVGVVIVIVVAIVYYRHRSKFASRGKHNYRV